MQQQQLESLNIDLDKMPLGSISDKQAEAGYAVLTKISAALKSPLPDERAQQERLLGLTNAFYTTIPHKFMRQQTPPVITSPELLVQKVDAMEALLSVSAAHSIAAGQAGCLGGRHPADDHYANLNCKLEPADAQEVAMVREFAANTHAATHNSYALRVAHVFRADRQGEKAKHRTGVGNRMLLWHGSRLTNWVGILSQGLRIAPPEAPVTGYMFGKGAWPQRGRCAEAAVLRGGRL